MATPGLGQDPLYEKCPAAPPSVELDGGARFLSPERVARLDCLMATCDARRKQLEAAPPAISATTWVLFAVGVLAGGFAGVWVMWQLRGLLR